MSRFHLRSYTLDDIEQLIDIQKECFPPPFPSELWWKPEQIECHVKYFPEGAICIEEHGTKKLVASSTSLIVDIDLAHPDHTWAEITDHGYIRNHNPQGNTLYGVDIAVRPSYRKRSLAKMMYSYRFDMVIKRHLKRFMTGARLAHYYRYREKLTPEEYAQEVIKGHLIDPTLTPVFKIGLRPIKVLHEYLPDEEASNCALLFQWTNPNL